MILMINQIHKLSLKISIQKIANVNLSYFVNQNNRCIVSSRRRTITQQERCQSTQIPVPDSVINSQISNIGIFKTLSESSPVQFLQHSLVEIHSYTGLPWWATIIISTVLMRSSITLPLAIYQQYILAKIELLKYEMNDIIKELKVETAMAMKNYGWNEDTARRIFNKSAKSQWNKLIIRENCHPFKSTLLIWVQIPLWVSLSISLRNMIYMGPVRDLTAETIYSQLCVEGIAWISNLTEMDNCFILPIAFGLINLTIIELTTMSKVTVPTRFQKVITNVFRGFTIILIPLCAYLPSGLLLYWTTSSSFGLFQNVILMSPKVKRFFKIPPTPSELEQPYKQLLATMKSRINLSNSSSKNL